MGNYDAEIRVSTKVDTSQMQRLQIQIDKAVNKVDALTKKYDELKNKKVPTQEYIEVQKQIENTKKKINDLQARQEKFLATGGKTSSSSYKKMEYDLEELRNSLPYLKDELQDLVDTGKAFTLGSSEEINKTANDLAQAKSELRMLVTKQAELGEKSVKASDGLKKIGSAAKKAFGEVSTGAKRSSGLLSTFTSRLKGIALSLLIFNWITKAFNSMISGMKTGFTNLMNYSDSFANSVQGMKNALSTLGNQIAAAFAPIIQLVIPWLTQLINTISTAMTYVAQFIAILGGKSTFTRAKQVQDSYNKSLGNTAKAADKARGALAKFDDLDVLEKKQEDNNAGGAADAAKDMFEEVPVDSKFKDWLDGILEKIKPILDYFKKLKDIFMEGFWDGLGDWEYRLESIKSSLLSIKESLIDIFTDPAVLAAADAWAQSVAYMLGSLVGSIASIGLTIATNLLGGIAKYLEQNKDRIKEYLISMFDIQTEVNYMLADFFQSFAYVFEAFASEQGQQLTANLIGIFTDAFMGVTELAEKLARDLLEIIIFPFTENKEEFRTALEGFLGVLAEVTGTIKQGIDDTFDKLNEVYDAHFKPFFDSIAQGISDLTSKFLRFWNGTVQPVLESWANKFDDLWKGHIQPFFNSVADLLGSVADALKTLWEQSLKPTIEWVQDNILPVIIPILETVYNTVVTVIGDIADFLTGFVNIVKGIVDLIINLINGDWSGAWESAKGIVENVFNTLLAFTEAIWDSFIGVIGSALQIIVGLFQITFIGIYDFLTQTFTSIYDTIIGIWTGIIEWFTENFNSLQEFISYILENIVLFFTEAWENVTLTFQTFIDFINETVIPIWEDAWNTASSLFQNFYNLINQLIKTIKELFDGFMKSIKLLIDGDWKGAWENAKKVFDEFKTKVDNIISTVRGILESFFNWVSEMIASVLESIGNIGSAVKSIFTGGGGGESSAGGNGRAAAPSMMPYSAQSFASLTRDLPHLASGAVLRGGSPFMAVLNDQPHGQTNVETPLETIKQAVREEMSGMGYGNISSVPTKLILNINGEDVGEAIIDDLLSVMQRRGLDVEVLGVT